MNAHPDNAAVLEKASWALANLARNDDNKVAITAAGGIAVRIAALGHHLYPFLCLPFTSSPSTPTPNPNPVTICPNANSYKNKTQIHPTLTKSGFSVTPIVLKLDINHNLNHDATPTLNHTR